MSRHAEIAGAGIGGLALATALCHRGWSVRVHERAAELRELGVGTTLWGNGLAVLQSLGVFDDALEGATAIETIEVFDENRSVMRSVSLEPASRESFVVLRTSLHRALVKAALGAGAEIVTESPIIGATRDGFLLHADGRRLAAELAVGADGYRSAVRDSLDLAIESGSATDSYIGRIAVPARSHRGAGSIREFWSGDRCCGVLTCGAYDYLFLSAPEHCPINAEEVERGTLDRSTWVASFPVLAEHLPQELPPVIWGRYGVVTCRSWFTGRAALIGDAAHGMPSTLAQGAGCALTNALALAVELGDHDVEAALQIWEAAQRPTTDLTQRWAILYLTILKRWPQNLLAQRADMIREAFGQIGVANHFSTASRQRVRGSEAP